MSNFNIASKPKDEKTRLTSTYIEMAKHNTKKR